MKGAKIQHNFYRSPHTAQEKRANIEHKNDGLVRGKRKNLPDNWDDIHINQGVKKNWKNKRKTQYHIKSGNQKRRKIEVNFDTDGKYFDRHIHDKLCNLIEELNRLKYWYKESTERVYISNRYYINNEGVKCKDYFIRYKIIYYEYK